MDAAVSRVSFRAAPWIRLSALRYVQSRQPPWRGSEVARPGCQILASSSSCSCCGELAVRAVVFNGLDGCFIKLTTGQQILAATGRDGNNNIFPISFRIVEKEDTTSWCWFLTQLRYCIGEAGKFGNYTIISDRQKGLLKAVSKVFPNSPQRFCPRHIFANFQQAGFRGQELKKHIDSASYSYTKSGFDQAMEALKADCEEAYNWLSQIPVETWVRFAFDYNCKTDLVVNNLSEVFKKMILDVRSKPIWTMVDGIRTKLMVKYCGIRAKQDSTRWEITPFYCEKLEEAKKYSRYCNVVAADKALGLWQVTSGDRIHPVNLIAKTCGCKKWDLTGIPCNHAISAIMKEKNHPEDYVLVFFKKPLYFEAYKHVVYPVPGPDACTNTDTQDIDPPPSRPRPRRKQTKRRKGLFEVLVPKDTSRIGTITCKNCKKTGHRFSNCDIPLRPQLQIRKAHHQANRHIFAEDTPGCSSAARSPRTAPEAPPKRTPAARASTQRAPGARAST